MGTLTTPAAGDIYTDTQTLIYTVQRHPVYAPLCRPLWQAATTGQNRVYSSDLALMETLVMPLRNADTVLQAQFERFLLHSDVTLLPITQDVLREAARLRAAVPALKTPMRSTRRPHACTAAPSLSPTTPGSGAFPACRLPSWTTFSRPPDARDWRKAACPKNPSSSLARDWPGWPPGAAPK